MFFPLTAKPAARLLLLAASLLATQQALALTPANPWQQHPTCQHVAANTCIDSPGSFAPPVAGSAALSGPPAQSQASALAKKKAATAVTASSGGVVYFVDTNQTINQMFYNGTQWVDINLMTSSQSGVHVALGTDVTVDNNGFVYYVDTGGTIHQMWWAGSQWVDAFLMASSQSGTTVQPGSNVTVDSVGSVYYVSSGQTVHKMWWGNSEGRWLDADLMASSQSGFQVEAFTGVTVDSSYSIYYVGTGLTIHKMWFQGSQFVDADLMASSQSGYNVQPGSQVTVDANFNIYYVTTAQAVHQMYWGTNQFVDVSIHNSLLVEPGTGVTVDTSGSVYYVDTGQTVHKMYISGSQWVDAYLMASTQSGFVVVPGGGVAVDGSGDVYYVDPGQTIHEMFWVGTQFADANLMASSQSGLHVSVAFLITGQVTNGGAGLNGVTVTLSGTTASGASVSQTATTTTVGGSAGEYTFLVADNGNYSVTTSLAGYTFSPPSETFSSVSGNVSAPTIPGVDLTCGAMVAYNPANPASTGDLSVAKAIPQNSGVTFYITGYSASTTSVTFNVSGPVNTSASGQLASRGWGAQITAPGSSWPVGGYEVVAVVADSANHTLACQAPGYFTVATPTPAFPTASCNSVAGTWTEQDAVSTGGSEPTMTWNLTQSGSSVGGSASFISPGGCWPNGLYYGRVSGTISPQGAAQFTITASDPSPSASPTCYGVAAPTTQTDTITFSTSPVNDTNTPDPDNQYNGQTQSNCSSGSGTWSNATGNNGSIPSITAQNLPVPVGETTTFAGFSTTDGLSTQAQFQQLLTSNSGANFEGRIVVETDSTTASGIPAATDGCYFGSSSAVSPVVGNSHSFWYVQSGNVYGYDVVGLAPASAGYYQKHMLASGGPVSSCTITVPSRMEMLPGIYPVPSNGAIAPPGTPYDGVFDLQITLTPSQATVSRNGVQGSTQFSQHN